MIKRIVRVTSLIVLACVVAFGVSRPAWTAEAGKSPVKVFILAGQSNMEGHGAIAGKQKGTLETLLKDPNTAPRYKQLVDKDGKWVVRNDVWLSYYDTKGPLTIGKTAAKNSIGPEIGFGWVVGDYLENPVLLIKVAAGGTSLAGPWRSPSSCKDNGRAVGGLYTGLIAGVKKQIADIKADFPDLAGRGVEIAGFGWHQGWNDGCSAKDTAEYETNMVNFIKDVRKDLGAANMPFVIGGSGFGGWGQTVDRRLGIMKAQKAAAERPEFKGNVMYVETRDFFREAKDSPNRFGFHWNANAETHYLIGEAMGKAMVEMLGGPKAPVNPTTRPSDRK